MISPVSWLNTSLLAASQTTHQATIALSQSKTSLADTVTTPFLYSHQHATTSTRLHSHELSPSAAEMAWEQMTLAFAESIPGTQVNLRSGGGYTLLFKEPDYLIHHQFDISVLLRLAGRILENDHFFVQRQGHDVTLNIPTLKNIQDEIDHIQYELPSVRLTPVASTLSRNEVNQYHLASQHPVSFLSENTLLDDADISIVVAPLLFALHDIYHATMLATLHPWPRLSLAKLYCAIAQADQLEAHVELKEALLDKLADLDYAHRPFETIIRNIFHPEKNSPEENTAIQQILSPALPQIHPVVARRLIDILQI